MKINFSHTFRIVRFGFKNLWMHKLRSLLTMLGIVFGVASVIAMLAIGEGASFEAREKIKELGSHNVIIRSVEPPQEAKSQNNSRVSVYGLKPVDLKRIKTIPSVERIVPTWEMKKEIWHLDKSTPGRIVATIPEYAEVANLRMKQGRFLNYIDNNKPVALMGSSVERALFPTENPIGKKIKIGGSYFKVIGLAEEKSFSGTNGTFEAEDINFDIYIPLTTSRELFGEFVTKEGSVYSRGKDWVKFHRFLVKVEDENKIVTTSALINRILSSTHEKNDYEILVPLELLKQAEHTRKIFNIVLGSIAAISLVVGGIGIMNIMLATVTERTREIGIRRALGAKRKAIIHQFLAETVILSSTGGFVGIVLGIIIPTLVNKFAGMTTLVTLWSVLIAFIISVAVGITFGIYPAKKAAFLDPIQALRYE